MTRATSSRRQFWVGDDVGGQSGDLLAVRDNKCKDRLRSSVQEIDERRVKAWW